MTDGLKDTHRAAIIATLAANDRVERAVLFGSRATGTNTVSSDVDIALFGDRLTLSDQARLAAALDEIPMAQTVDLLLYDSIKDRTLREHIRHQGVEWYARPAQDESRNTASESGPEWPVVKLEDVSSDETGSIAIGPFGSRMKSDVYTPSGVPVIRGTNISSSRAWRNDWVYVSDDFADGLPNCNVREGDLVFPHRGSIGAVAIVPGDRARYTLSTSLMKFRPDPEKVSALFLFYYFRSDAGRAEIMRYSSQVGTPGIGQPLTSLRQFRVPIPPREEQERIAGILSALDDKIEMNRQMSATLEAMVRTLFRSWFIDFDPVRAKMEGRDTGLPKDVTDLFPERLVDSELGEIPEGWPLVPLPELVEINPSRSLRRGDIAPYLDMANMPTAGHAPDHVLQRPFNSGMRFANGDTLVARITPCLENGKTAYVDFLRYDEIGWGSTEYIVLKPRHPLPSEFAYPLARNARFREFAIQNMSGTSGRQRVPAAALSGFSMPSPPVAVGAAFGRAARSLLRRARTAVDECRVLANCRDALLPKVVSGEVRVKVPRTSSEQSHSGDTAQRTGSEGASTTDSKKHAGLNA